MAWIALFNIKMAGLHTIVRRFIISALCLSILISGCMKTPPESTLTIETENPRENEVHEKLAEQTYTPIKPRTPDGSDIALSVEDWFITMDELNKIFNSLNNRGQSKDVSDAEKWDVIQQQVNQLVLLKAALEANADKDPEFQKLLMPVYRDLLVDFFTVNSLYSTILVTQNEVENYYNTHSNEFIIPPTISVRFILTRSRDQAGKALEELRRGKSFESVAREFSQHDSAVEGGLLEPFTSGTYDPDFEAAASQLEVGEMSGIVNTGIGYCLIEKTGETKSRTQSLEEVSDDIKETLLAKKKNEMLQQYIESRRKEYKVYISPGLYDYMNRGANNQ